MAQINVGTSTVKFNPLDVIGIAWDVRALRFEMGKVAIIGQGKMESISNEALTAMDSLIQELVDRKDCGLGLDLNLVHHLMKSAMVMLVHGRDHDCWGNVVMKINAGMTKAMESNQVAIQYIKNLDQLFVAKIVELDCADVVKVKFLLPFDQKCHG